MEGLGGLGGGVAWLVRGAGSGGELTCTVTSVTPDLLSLCVCLQPEEYGQEAMEGQGEGILDPEGETYDETQQVSSTQHATRSYVAQRVST